MRAEALSKCERPQTAGSREDRARYSSSSSWSAFTDPSSDKEHFHLPRCHRRLFSTVIESRRSKICSSSGDDSSLDLNSTGSLKSSPKSSTKSSVKSNSSDDVFRPHHLKSKSKRTGVPETLFLHPGIRFSSHKEAERTRSCSSASKLSLTSSQGLSAACKRLEQKITSKLKFSEFLDEVTYSVLDPVSLKAFGVLKQKAPVLHTTSLPCCKALEALGSMRKSSEPRNPVELVGKAYLETDIDSVRSKDTAEAEKKHGAPQERRGSWSNQETRAQADRMRSSSPAFERSKRIPKNKSASLPRCVTMVSTCFPNPSLPTGVTMLLLLIYYSGRAALRSRLASSRNSSRRGRGLQFKHWLHAFIKAIKMQGKNTPIKMQGKNTPIKMQGKNTPIKMQGKNTPIKMQGKNTPIKMQGKNTPIKMQGKNTPIKMQGKNTPIKMQGKNTPIKMQGKNTPIKMQGNSKNCNYCISAVVI
ncbi:UNVERIFIED_CONTAM: hypothetical protein FKN15_002052 [Acipenser sinensis]